MSFPVFICATSEVSALISFYTTVREKTDIPAPVHPKHSNLIYLCLLSFTGAIVILR